MGCRGRRELGVRALWFTNCELPDTGSAESGHWMSELARALLSDPKVQLGFAHYGLGRNVVSRKTEWGPAWTLPISKFGERYAEPTRRQVESALAVAVQFDPDVIHIHGTEQNFGWLSTRSGLDVPSVISLQGLTSVCWRHDLGGMSEREARRLASPKDRLLREGLVQNQRRRYRESRCETEILARGRAFIGRTRWDRAHLRARNTGALYFHCDEVMRAPFLKGGRVFRGVRPATVFTCVQPEPLKGLHVLLRAMATVRKRFPSATLRVAGRRWGSGWRARGFENYLNGLLDELDMRRCVEFLGPLDGEALAEELKIAAAAAIPSFVDNSSNSLAEAMLMGVPAVASFAGGMGTAAHDGETAFLCPPGDAEFLAECICEIFADPGGAELVGARGRQVALFRHDPMTIAARTLEIYHEVAAAW